MLGMRRGMRPAYLASTYLVRVRLRSGWVRVRVRARLRARLG